MTRACLNSDGAVDSRIHKLISLVIGKIKVSRQDLMSRVGMVSKEHVESDVVKIARRTSSSVAYQKPDKLGGGLVGAAW